LAQYRFFVSPLMLFNLGCEAIFRGTIEILSRSFAEDDLQFVMPSYWAEADRQRMSDLDCVEIVPMSRVQGLKRIILRKLGRPSWKLPRYQPRILDQHFDMALGCGGDIYADMVPFDWIGLEYQFTRLGRPYVLWGANFEKFENHPRHLDLVIGHLNRCKLITARDLLSKDYLAKYGITDNVVEVMDPAFHMDPIEYDIEPYLPTTRGVCCAGVNLSPVSQGYYPEPHRFVEEVARGCEQFIDHSNGSVVLISHVLCPYDSRTYDDVAFHEKVYRQMNPKYHDRVGRMNVDIGSPRVKYLISQLDVYAGTRMHSTIASLSSLIPTLAIPYSAKARGLNDLIFDHRRWLLPVSELTGESLCDKLCEVYENRDTIRKTLGEKMPDIKRRSMLAGEYVARILKVRASSSA